MSAGRRTPQTLIAIAAPVLTAALFACALFGILTALLAGPSSVPYWLAHPDAYAFVMRALDYAAVTLFWAAVFVAVIPPRPTPGDGPRRAYARVALAIALPIALALVFVQLVGFSVLLCLVAGWAVAVALRDRPRRILFAALALAGCVAMAGLYFGAEAAVREAWRTRNLALLAEAAPYPEATLLGVHTGDGYTSAVGAWTNREELQGLLLTRWHIPQAASSTRLRYRLPAAVTRDALLTWYQRELGPEWRWSSAAEAAGRASRGADLIWVYEPYPGGRDQTGPGEVTEPGYSVEAWSLVPGVTYGDQGPPQAEPTATPSAPATRTITPPPPQVPAP